MTSEGQVQSPRRIQRKREKGWTMPKGAVYVGRPGRWGNPFEVINGHRQGWLLYDRRDRGSGYLRSFTDKRSALYEAVRLYRKSMYRQVDLTPLSGRDLACWCPLDWPCHADVLLDLANPGVMA